MERPDDWTTVFEAASRLEAELVKGRLQENGISAIVMDQGAHAYPQLARALVLVRRDDVVKALYLVRQAPEA